MSLSLNKAFALPSLNNYSKSLSLKGLLVKAVEMFVGSRGSAFTIQPCLKITLSQDNL